LAVVQSGTPAAAAQVTSGTGTVATSASAAWGTGQNRAAGNLLVALVTAYGSTSAGATAQYSGTSGWSKVAEYVSTACVSAIWTKPAAGGDAVPRFQSSISGTSVRTRLSITLVELTDNVRSGACPVLDTYGQNGGTSGTLTTTTVAAVSSTGVGAYALGCDCATSGSSGTNTWTASGSWAAEDQDGASAYSHWINGQYPAPPQGSTLAWAPTHTITTTYQAGATAVFKPGPMTWAATAATAGTPVTAGDLLLAPGAVTGTSAGASSAAGAAAAPAGVIVSNSLALGLADLTPLTTGAGGNTAAGGDYLDSGSATLPKFTTGQSCHGAGSMYVDTTAGACYAAWTVAHLAAQPYLYARFYLRAATAADPAGRQMICQVVNGSTLLGGVTLTTGRVAELQTGSSTFVSASASGRGTPFTAIPRDGRWVRVEFYAEPHLDGTSVYTIRLTGHTRAAGTHDDPGPDEEATWTGQPGWATATINGIRYGSNTAAIWQAWIADIAASQIRWLGPVAVATAVTVSATSGVLTITTGSTWAAAGSAAGASGTAGALGEVWAAGGSSSAGSITTGPLALAPGAATGSSASVSQAAGSLAAPVPVTWPAVGTATSVSQAAGAAGEIGAAAATSTAASSTAASLGEIWAATGTSAAAGSTSAAAAIPSAGTRLGNNLELGLADLTALTLGAAGNTAAGGDYLDSGSATLPQYTSAVACHGTGSMYVNTGGTAARWAGWSSALIYSPTGSGYFRFYLRCGLGADPAARQFVCQALRGTPMGGVTVTIGRIIELQTATGTYISAAAGNRGSAFTPLPKDSRWVRVELYAEPHTDATSTYTIRLTGHTRAAGTHDDPGPDEECTWTGQPAAAYAQINGTRYGANNTGAWECWVDDPAFAQDGWIGPVAATTWAATAAAVATSAASGILTPPATTWAATGTSTATPATAGALVIRKLLIPAVGHALWGAFPAPSSGSPYGPGPEVYEGPSISGRMLAVITSYQWWRTTWPDATYKAYQAAGRINHVRWTGHFGSPVTDYTKNTQWTDVAAGVYDADITAKATELATWGQPIFVSLYGEFDGTSSSWPIYDNATYKGGAWTSADETQMEANFVAAWRHIHDLAAPIAPNIIWCWVIQSYQSSAHAARCTAMYPGDDYVDWVGADPYDRAGPGNAIYYGNPYDAYHQTIDLLRTIAPGKPVGVFETGCDNPDYGSTNTDAQRRDWIELIPQACIDLDIRFWQWFNSPNGILLPSPYGDSTGDHLPDPLACGAIATIGSDPVFAGVTTWAVAGSSTGTDSTAGALGEVWAAAGTSARASSTAGGLALAPGAIAGTSLGTPVSGGAVGEIWQATGISVTSSSTGGAVTVTLAATGASTTGSSAAGALLLAPGAVTGTSAGTPQTAGGLAPPGTTTWPAQGAAASSSAASGAAGEVWALAGSSAKASATAGPVTLISGPAGTSVAVSAGSGSLTYAPGVVTGSSAGVSAGTGILVPPGATTWPAQGTSTGTSSAAGAFGPLHAIAGSSSSTSSSSSTVTYALSIAGTSAEVSAASGALLLQPGVIAGTSAGSSTAAGTLPQIGTITATALSASATAAAVGLLRQMAGSSAGSSATGGYLTVISRPVAVLQLAGGPAHGRWAAGPVPSRWGAGDPRSRWAAGP
jgi:hypothetical protein